MLCQKNIKKASKFYEKCPKIIFLRFLEVENFDLVKQLVSLVLFFLVEVKNFDFVKLKNSAVTCRQKLPHACPSNNNRENIQYPWKSTWITRLPRQSPLPTNETLRTAVSADSSQIKSPSRKLVARKIIKERNCTSCEQRNKAAPNRTSQHFFWQFPCSESKALVFKFKLIYWARFGASLGARIILWRLTIKNSRSL